MSAAKEKNKNFRVENHLPEPIFVELWKKRNDEKITLYIRAYPCRPASRYYVQKLATEQALNVEITKTIDFEFTSYLGRDVMGQLHPINYGYLLSIDFFAKGADR